jgi:hypothetical protein
MRRASIILAVLATTLAGRAPLAQAQESSAPQAQAKKGPTLGGHIGFVLPLVTQSGGRPPVWQISLRLDFRLGSPLREAAAPPSTSNLSHNTMQRGNG